MEPIVNKIANSSLITIDLEEVLKHPKEVKEIDMKHFLFQELILKEKDYRAALKAISWKDYNDSIVAITNSVDAIIPTWAYMLLATYLEGNCLFLERCKSDKIKERYYLEQVSHYDLTEFNDKRIILKGCGDLDIPSSVYTRLSARLTPIVKSLMYGEPCSTVPVYKKK